MITRDGNRIKTRHIARAVGDDVTDNLHARCRRINVGIAHHELFENIVLDGSGQLVLGDTLLFSRHDITGQYRQYSAVHSHGNRDFIQRNTVEQDFHILHRVDCHARFTHIAGNPWMIGVVAAVCRQVKGNGNTLPACIQRFAIKSIGFLGSRKSSVLPDRPGTSGIHGRLGAAHVGRHTRHGIGVFQVLRIGGGVQGLNHDIFSRLPGQAIRALAL